MKAHSEARSGTGVSKAVIEHESIEAQGVLISALVDTGTYDTEISDRGGLLIVRDDTATDSAIFAIVDTAGTLTTQLQVTNVNFTGTADNAGTVNVYFSSGVIRVQNNSGQTIDAVIKGIL